MEAFIPCTKVPKWWKRYTAFPYTGSRTLNFGKAVESKKATTLGVKQTIYMTQIPMIDLDNVLSLAERAVSHLLPAIDRRKFELCCSLTTRRIVPTITMRKDMKVGMEKESKIDRSPTLLLTFVKSNMRIVLLVSGDLTRVSAMEKKFGIVVASS